MEVFMKVTNTSPVPQKVRGVEGVVEIKSGMSRQMDLTPEQATRIRERSGVELEEPTKIVAKPRDQKAE
jgi:hypothetical protein